MMPTLTLEFWTEDKDFKSYATLGNYEKELNLKGRAKEIVTYFDTIYDILEEKQTQREKILQNTLATLGSLLLAPFAQQLQTCDLVRIVVYEDLTHCTFDLLPFKDQPLFLRYPICYQVVEGEGEDQPQIELTNALLIADLTADPEQACAAVAKLLPESTYFEMPDANLNTIKKAVGGNVLVISGHGELDDDGVGSISLNAQTITDNTVGKLECWIVYFDSCQQGINQAFLDAFQADSDVQYYLAPIISNDAGDSSTYTLIWFFTAVMAHGNPIRALFETRKKLHTHYTQQGLDLVTTLNKAFAFRLYEFVTETE